MRLKERKKNPQKQYKWQMQLSYKQSKVCHNISGIQRFNYFVGKKNDAVLMVTNNEES